MYFNILKKAAKEPKRAFLIGKGIILGNFYRQFYNNFSKKVVIGKRLRVNGKMSIKGPGKVYIGNDVSIGMVTTLWTYSENAILTIGNNTFLNGTRFACENNIFVGNNVILADCRIMDTDFHGIYPNNRNIHKTFPIKIEDGVWITIECVILKGSIIGKGATVTPKTVINGNVPANSLYGSFNGEVLKMF